MAENPVIRKNEEQTNQIIARVMRRSILFLLLIIPLNLIGLFTTPLEQYLIPFTIAALLLGLPSFLIWWNKTGPWFKYLLVGCALFSVTALYVNYWEIGRFTEFLWLFPVIIACAYLDPRMTAVASGSAILLMSALFAMAMPNRPAYYTEFVTVHNIYADILLRAINMAAVTASLFGLASRFHRALSDLVSAEEQNVILSRLAKVMGEAGKAARTLVASSDQLNSVSEHLDSASGQTVGLSKELADVAEQTLGHIRQANPAIVKMADQIQGLAQTIGHVSEAAAAMDQLAQTGKVSLVQAAKEMRVIERLTEESRALVDRLGERSIAIGQIVRVITNIARQTKLLALNASMEAARAGEEGRGFQAVAISIRDLATQASQAAETITGLIGEIQEQTAETVSAIDRGTEEIKSGLSSIAMVEEAFTQVAVSEESVRSRVDFIADTLTQLAAGGELIISSVREIEARNLHGAEGAQSLAAAVRDQSAAIRQIREELARLRETAETLRRLGGA